MMGHNVQLLTAKEASLQFFNGKRSAWSLLQDVKKGRLPAIHFGNRVFLEANALNAYIEQELQKSLSTEVTEIDGIREIL